MGRSKNEAIPYNDESSDDDAPMEVTSKKKVINEKGETGCDIKLVDSELEGPTLFEEVQSRKKAESDRKMKREKRMHKITKLGGGEFFAQTKTASFKVVTLVEGIQKALKPQTNFRAELLAARTAGKRDSLGVKSITKRTRWLRKS